MTDSLRRLECEILPRLQELPPLPGTLGEFYGAYQHGTEASYVDGKLITWEPQLQWTAKLAPPSCGRLSFAPEHVGAYSLPWMELSETSFKLFGRWMLDTHRAVTLPAISQGPGCRAWIRLIYDFHVYDKLTVNTDVWVTRTHDDNLLVPVDAEPMLPQYSGDHVAGKPGWCVATGQTIQVDNVVAGSISVIEALLGRVPSGKPQHDARTTTGTSRQDATKRLSDALGVDGLKELTARLQKGDLITSIAAAFGVKPIDLLYTEPCVDLIRRLAKAKTLQKDIAARFGIDRSLISRVGAANGIEFRERGRNLRKSPT